MIPGTQTQFWWSPRHPSQYLSTHSRYGVEFSGCHQETHWEGDEGKALPPTADWTKLLPHWWRLPRPQIQGDHWTTGKEALQWRDLWSTFLTELSISLLKNIQSSAVITWSNITSYCTHRCRNSGRIWTHKRHPILRPLGRAMGGGLL